MQIAGQIRNAALTMLISEQQHQSFIKMSRNKSYLQVFGRKMFAKERDVA